MTLVNICAEPVNILLASADYSREMVETCIFLVDIGPFILTSFPTL